MNVIFPRVIYIHWLPARPSDEWSVSGPFGSKHLFCVHDFLPIFCARRFKIRCSYLPIEKCHKCCHFYQNGSQWNGERMQIADNERGEKAGYFWHVISHASGYLRRLWTRNRPFPSSPGPVFQNEGRCLAFDMEIIFHSQANETQSEGFWNSKVACGRNISAEVQGKIATQAVHTGHNPFEGIVLGVQAFHQLSLKGILRVYWCLAAVSKITTLLASKITKISPHKRAPRKKWKITNILLLPDFVRQISL